MLVPLSLVVWDFDKHMHVVMRFVFFHLVVLALFQSKSSVGSLHLAGQTALTFELSLTFARSVAAL